MVRFNNVAALCVIFVTAWHCGNAKIKAFQSNEQVSGVTYTKTVRSLLECSILYENSKNSLSFNFRRETKSCELSMNYPEHHTTVAEGWQVYSKIVNGVWTNWNNWSSCSAACGGGTRSRTRMCTNPSPSNGGESCPNHSSETASCNVQACIPGTYSGSYFISTSQVTWDEAKVACEGMSRKLVIIDDQAEQDFLDSAMLSFHHWIGLRCQNGLNCVWVDGSTMESGFTNWAPAEPKDRDCVWIGWYVNKWDDDYCDALREFICEL